MKQTIPFSGIQNSDAALKNMPLGQHPSLYMLEDGRYYGKQGYLVGKRGTANTGTILAEGEIVVGTAKWIERGRIVYFIYSPLDDHAIAYYDIATDTHVKMGNIIPAGLDPDYPIIHAEVIDNVLWWTDGKFEGFYDDGLPLYNAPYRLNLERLENGEYGLSVDLQTINVIKYPSPFSPTWEYAYTPSFAANYLRGKLFQFRIQYVYEDGEESAWSPISRLNLPQSAGFINNSQVPEPNSNSIRLRFNTGHFTATKIKIAVSVNHGQFGVFKTLDKAIEGIPSDIEKTIEFFGDSSYQAVELDTRNYDNVPLSAVCMSKLVDEICYTNIVRGYDRILPDIVVEYPITELEGYKINVCRLSAVKTNVRTFQLSWTDANGTESLQFQEGDYFTFQLEFTSTSGVTNVSLVYYITQANINAMNALPTPQAGRDYLINIIGTQFVSLINSAVSGAATGTFAAPIYTIALGTAYTITSDLPEAGLRPYRLQNTQRTLKKGGKYKWYIQYYDRGNRDGTAITSEAMEVRVPFVTDQDVSSLSYAGAPYKVNAQITINHLPPSWATHYQILVAKSNGISDFQQTTVTDLDVLNDGNYRLSLQTAYQANNNGAVINHQIKKGDRVRFMYQGVQDLTSPQPVNYITNYFECEVLSYEPAGGVDNSPAIFVQSFDLSLIDWNKNRGILIEIYTPSIDSDVERIFEVGEEYEIINATYDDRYHAGNVQNQNGTQPAILGLDYGDVYIRTRMLGTGYEFPNQVFYYYCEDPHYSDFYVSNFNSQGRVGIENVNAKNDRFNISVHGGKYLKENNLSSVNNLCRFEFGDNTQEYDPQYGLVVRTITDGKTLKVLQPQKEVSVYLNGTYTVNADGGVSAPAFSSKVFGGFRPYETLFGCSDGRMAVLVPKMGVLYYDEINEEFIYSLTNGQRRISLDGAFLTKSSEIANIIRGENFTCASFVESQLGKVGFNFRSDNGLLTVTYNYDTLSFGCDHVSRPVWFYENIGDTLLAFDTDLNAYKYNVEGEKSFHDLPYGVGGSIVCNDPIVQNKVFQNVQYQAKGAMNINAYIEENDSYSNQQTDMPIGIQELLEGAHFAQFRMNKFSGTIKTPAYYLVNGDPLRGDHVEVEFSLEMNEEVNYPEIILAIVEFFPSEILN